MRYILYKEKVDRTVDGTVTRALETSTISCLEEEEE